LEMNIYGPSANRRKNGKRGRRGPKMRVRTETAKGAQIQSTRKKILGIGSNDGEEM
jgi:hypothetical protein